jgi:hypothetical protein
VESKRALDELIAKNGDNYSFLMAEVFAWRGERDHAFEWLARARAQRDTGLIWLEVAVLLRGLQDDPRWKKLLVSVNLPVE